jgi:adenylate kinase
MQSILNILLVIAGIVAAANGFLSPFRNPSAVPPAKTSSHRLNIPFLNRAGSVNREVHTSLRSNLGRPSEPSSGISTTKKKPLKIIIAGAPASGKGTQCEIIQEKYGVVHLSTGDMLRAAVKAETELGKKAKEFMNAGKLVPDELIIGVVKERLNQDDCKCRGWLLDGFPRTKSQADALIASGMIPDAFILLDVPEDVLVERVTGRRTDPVTLKVYHMKFNPPENDVIAARLEQRSDDTEEKIKIRYKEFQSHIAAIRSSYEDKLIFVNGSQAKKIVTDTVKNGLDKVLEKKESDPNC